MKTKRIKFVEDFTDCPGGRLRIHGDHSGEQFREDILLPALREFDEVILDLNGAYGFPVSFIDEAFGVLGSEFGRDLLEKKLKIVLEDDASALREIYSVIEQHSA